MAAIEVSSWISIYLSMLLVLTPCRSAAGEAGRLGAEQLAEVGASRFQDPMRLGEGRVDNLAQVGRDGFDVDHHVERAIVPRQVGEVAPVQVRRGQAFAL